MFPEFVKGQPALEVSSNLTKLVSNVYAAKVFVCAAFANKCFCCTNVAKSINTKFV